MEAWRRELFGLPVVDLLPRRRRGLPGIAVGVRIGETVMRIATTRALAAQGRAAGVPVISPLEAVTAAWAALSGPLSASRALGESLAAMKAQRHQWPGDGAGAWPEGGIWWPGEPGECGAQHMASAPSFGFLAVRLGMTVLGVMVEGERHPREAAA